MKKLSLVLAALLFLCACTASPSASPSVEPSTDDNLSASPSIEESPTPESEDLSDTDVDTDVDVEDDADDEADIPSEAIEGEGYVGDHHVVIKGIEMGKDYSDADVVIVTYEWTNNGDDAVSFMLAFSKTVYQNGIECNNAIMVEGVENQDQMKDIKPGATQEIRCAYVLNDDSQIEVEVTELISFGDSDVVTKFFDLP